MPAPVIVSGFEPFQGRAVNASYEFARAIKDQFPEVVLLQTPVRWDESAAIVQRAFEEKPRFWLACGEAPSTFRLETCARNLRLPRPDNLGAPPPTEQIEPNGPAAFLNRFDVHPVVEELQAKGYPCLVSSDAGSYLCEELLYTLLSAQAGQPGTEVLFLHVPHYGSDLIVNGVKGSFRGEHLRTAARDFFEAIVLRA
jgi:pyroglutamyl-peptidase